MSLASGDLTTPQRAAIWIPNLVATSPVVPMLISMASNQIYNKLNRARLYSQTFTRTIDGVGNYQILLPDYPVTAVTSIQMGSVLLQPYPLPNPTTGAIPNNTFGYGYRFVPWSGNLPGEPAVVEFVHGVFWPGAQNIKATYTAGYLISAESHTLPGTGGFSGGTASVTVTQPQGIWSRDNGVTYTNGTSLTPMASITAAGQYIPPVDASPGVYTFGVADANQTVLISYSFVPSDLELATIQMIAESNSYRTRIGEIEKVLGGQETIRYLRGGGGRQMFPELPPEVEALIWPYVSVIPPAIGAPV